MARIMAKTKAPDPILLEQLQSKVEHGDYQRIANLTVKTDGKPYTADYVRKVILGIRINQTILKKAQRYLKQKEKLVESLRKLGEE